MSKRAHTKRRRNRGAVDGPPLRLIFAAVALGMIVGAIAVPDSGPVASVISAALGSK